jgi:hypothetical protein
MGVIGGRYRPQKSVLLSQLFKGGEGYPNEPEIGATRVARSRCNDTIVAKVSREAVRYRAQAAL